MDLQYLRAMPLIDRHIDRDGIDRAFDEAVARNGWLIFYGHDVEDDAEPLWLFPGTSAPRAGSGRAPQDSGLECRRRAALRRRLIAPFIAKMHVKSAGRYRPEA